MNRQTIPIAVFLLSFATAARAQPSAEQPGAEQPGAAQPSTAQSSSAAAKVLMDQANYWFGENHQQEAESALDRLLRMDPDNAEALALLAQVQAQKGDRSHAEATLAHLRAVRPADPHIAAVEQAIRAGSTDASGLAEARRLTQEGRSVEAVARYRRLFQGAAPPANLAVEYYQTLAGTEGGWEAARAGLAQVALASPRDMQAQLAYARLLTYRDATRMEGMQRLAILSRAAETSAAATKAWHQALEWMPIAASSVPAYQAWLGDHPGDPGISERLQQAQNPPRTPADEAALKRTDGFTALNAGHIHEAETAFEAVLAQTPQDPEALGGLGLVRLRQGNTTEARSLLSRAIEADPVHKARWETALRGASVGEDYAAARVMIQRGQLDGAERQLEAIISSGGDVGGARLMLADVLSRRGDLPGAEKQYRAVLAGQPNNADALVGLAQILTKQGRNTEADAVLEHAQGAGDTHVVEKIRADGLRQQAATTNDPVAKQALLRAALSADPNNPWTRLDLARALLAGGKQAEARLIMAEATEGANPGTDALRAGALFAAEDNRLADAAAMVDRLPPAARTADMRALLTQATLQNDIRNAESLAAVSPADAHEKLLALAAQPDPDGARGVAIARAFLQMHNPDGARAALATAQAATHTPTPAQRIAYAGVLLQAGDERGAQNLIHTLDGAVGLTPEQTSALNRLRAGAAIREADRLNSDHRQADAYDVLAPVLARDPVNADVNLAVGRLYGAADDPRKELAISQAVLARDPDNLDARKAALGAAIRLRDWAYASALVQEGIASAPDDPKVWMMSAMLDRARGKLQQAYDDLKRARALRQQEIGSDQSGASQRSAGTGNFGSNAGSDAAGGNGNPFRRSEMILASTTVDVAAASPSPLGAVDPMLQDIDSQLTEVRQDQAPKFVFGPSFRARTGSPGLDQLNEISTPGQLIVRPLGQGILTATATPVFLSAGTVQAGSQADFGTGIFPGHPAPPSQHAQGVGLSAAYELGWLKADVGSSPVGFQQQNVLGGVELSPSLSDNVRLRVVAERRAVTDSVLSYAGTKDPGTGLAWGAVTRTRGHAQLEFTAKEATFYAGGGYSVLDGQNVASNNEIEFGAGGSYPIWRNTTDELRVGLDNVYFGYDKNLYYFTVGQGGYFSPQSYFATLIPLKYTSKHDDWTWSIGGSAGYQTYNEKSSAVFPDNPLLQNALVSAASTSPTAMLTSYPGQSASGVVGGVTGSVEYRISDSLVLGGQASYQHAGNWSETIGRVYTRFIFDGDHW
jgi:cellulose synthase operon protein C